MNLSLILEVVIFVLLALVYIRAWARSGFWMPRYAHWMAGVMFIFGCFMSYFAHGPGVIGFFKSLELPLALAAIVYGVFVFCGGANAALRQRQGKVPQEPDPPVNL